MSNTIHAFDFLDSGLESACRVIVIFGDDAFLKCRVNGQLNASLLGKEGSEINLVKLAGNQIRINDILDELDTISLFGGGKPRLVCVDDADSFVTENRPALEDYVGSPSSNGILILEVGPWRSNTKLYKAIDKIGLQIDCRPPMRGKSVDFKRIAKWVSHWGKKNHRVKIKPIVAEHMMDLTGPELGILDQNLAKLALYFDEKTEVTEEDVNEYIGGWQTKTIWDLIDCAIQGHTGAALTQLDKLLQNGESPIALYGQIGWSLRRFAFAFDEAHRFGRNQQRMNVDEVITNSGFRFPSEKKKAIEQLKKIGREKGSQYYKILLECDLALKASHSSPTRSRVALEKLIIDLVEKKNS